VPQEGLPHPRPIKGLRPRTYEKAAMLFLVFSAIGPSLSRCHRTMHTRLRNATPLSCTGRTSGSARRRSPARRAWSSRVPRISRQDGPGGRADARRRDPLAGGEACRPGTEAVGAAMSTASVPYAFGGGRGAPADCPGQGAGAGGALAAGRTRRGARGWRRGGCRLWAIGILDLLSEWVRLEGAVVGIERETHFAAMARAEIARRGVDNVTIVEADALEVAAAARLFDVIHERLPSGRAASSRCRTGIAPRWRATRRTRPGRCCSMPTAPRSRPTGRRRRRPRCLHCCGSRACSGTPSFRHARWIFWQISCRPSRSRRDMLFRSIASYPRAITFSVTTARGSKESPAKRGASEKPRLEALVVPFGGALPRHLSKAGRVMQEGLAGMVPSPA
jgi:hypothetical protein